MTWFGVLWHSSGLCSTVFISVPQREFDMAGMDATPYVLCKRPGRAVIALAANSVPAGVPTPTTTPLLLSGSLSNFGMNQSSGVPTGFAIVSGFVANILATKLTAVPLAKFVKIYPFF